MEENKENKQQEEIKEETKTVENKTEEVKDEKKKTENICFPAYPNACQVFF